MGWYEDFLGIILTTAGRYREALASYAEDGNGDIVVARLSHHLLMPSWAKRQQAEAALAKIKSSYPQFPGITLDEILKEEVFHEDPAIFDRYRAILQRIDKQE